MRKGLLCLVLGSMFALPATAQILIFPGTKFCTDPIPHSAVFSRFVTLTGGSTNHFLTTGTTGWFLQSVRPDPVMMLVNSAGVIVAFNDDFVGLDSDIIFTPPTTATFRLIVHSFATASAGFTNVMLSVNGASPTSLGIATEFAGTHVMTDWSPGITYDTAGGNGDTVLLVRTGAFVGATLAFNDDVVGTPGFPFMGRLNSSVIAPASPPIGVSDNVSTKAIVGSFSQFTEGQTTLCQVFRPWMSPALSPPHDAPRPAPLPNTPEMAQYHDEYAKLKSKLVEMGPDERDRAILELQRRILPESEIRTFAAPVSFATAAYVRAQKEYLERVRAREKELAVMEHDQRAKVLTEMKEETVGRALLKVEPDYGLPLETEQSAPPAKRP